MVFPITNIWFANNTFTNHKHNLLKLSFLNVTQSLDDMNLLFLVGKVSLKYGTKSNHGVMFEGDSANACGKQIPLIPGGRANGQLCADGERGPHQCERKSLNVSL